MIYLASIPLHNLKEYFLNPGIPGSSLVWEEMLNNFSLSQISLTCFSDKNFYFFWKMRQTFQQCHKNIELKDLSGSARFKPNSQPCSEASRPASPRGCTVSNFHLCVMKSKGNFSFSQNNNNLVFWSMCLCTCACTHTRVSLFYLYKTKEWMLNMKDHNKYEGLELRGTKLRIFLYFVLNEDISKSYSKSFIMFRAIIKKLI